MQAVLVAVSSVLWAEVVACCVVSAGEDPSRLSLIQMTESWYSLGDD